MHDVGLNPAGVAFLVTLGVLFVLTIFIVLPIVRDRKVDFHGMLDSLFVLLFGFTALLALLLFPSREPKRKKDPTQETD